MRTRRSPKAARHRWWFFALLGVVLGGAMLPKDAQADETPELDMDLGPWEGPSMRDTLSMRLAQVARDESIQTDQYRLVLSALSGEGPGAHAVIRDGSGLIYEIDIRLEAGLSREQSVRILATTLANSLDGIWSGRQRGRKWDEVQVGQNKARSRGQAEEVSEDEENAFSADLEEDEVLLDEGEDVAVSQKLSRKSKTRRSAMQKRRASLHAPARWHLSLGVGTTDALGAFFSGKLNALSPIELGMGAGLGRFVEGDLRGRYAFLRGPEADLDRLRGIVGLGLNVGWTRFYIPVKATAMVEHWSYVFKAPHKNEGLLLIRDKANAVGVGLRSGFHYRGRDLGVGLGFGLGVDVGVNYLTSLGQGSMSGGGGAKVWVKNEDSDWDGEDGGPLAVQPGPVKPRILHLDGGLEVEVALVLKLGRWRARK